MSDEPATGIVSRRKLIGALGVAGAGIAVGAAVGRAAEPQSDAAVGGDVVPFYATRRATHQAGIATAAQDRLHISAFDVVTESRSDLAELLRRWTVEAALMTQGRLVGPPEPTDLSPPADTGEALGLPPSRLTVTFGFGPTLFEADGHDRFGLASQRPAALVDLPPFPKDELDPTRTGGDLVVQACADDPVVAFHAVRNLTRLGRGIVAPRWSQLGFGRTASTDTAQTTPRNLQGFKDGTNNLKNEDAASMDRFVWVGAGDGPDWMQGGTYMVTRRIRMLIEVWDRSSLRDQEHTIGRDKASGAPLGEHAEFDTVPLTRRTPQGHPVIPADAHIRLAAPTTNDGEAILRRGYSFTDGIDPVTAQLDAGLFFICFQRDPRRQFIPIQQRLGANDALNEYIQHVGSGIFAVPPGARLGGFVGDALFA